MSPLRATWEVARWEFLRFFKIREILVGLVMAIVGGAGAFGLMRLADRGSDDPVHIAVAGVPGLPIAVPPESRLRIQSHPAERMPALRQAVERGELAGLVTWRADGPPALLAGEGARWRGELEQVLGAAAMQARFGAVGVRPEQLPALLAPVTLDVTYTADATPPRSRGETILTILAIVLSLMGVFTGVGYVFISITGEKQNRVAEQVVAAIPPQSWVDGKILGLSAITLANLTSMVLSFVLLGLGARALGVSLPALPRAAGSPGLIATLVLVTALGFGFWFAFMAMVAAVVDDPNTSSRSGLLMLPIAVTSLAFIAFRGPDLAITRVLSILPPFSASVLPVRMLLDRVPAWEVALAIVLLAGAVWLLRRAAGKVFHLGMLMYGKEPTWGEVRRWMRET
ncbi:MAG TPA: ABC transporter permease [Longimicrobium sp.]|nr:ABC transporter permease [Longimicrobium sp.]